jgi:uncharacterized protein (DUF2252 family)
VSRRAALVTLSALALACAPADARHAVVVNTLVEADLTLLRARPASMAGKYRRMALDASSFYRGSYPLFVRDALDAGTVLAGGAFALPDALALGIGDAHLENFGTLRASDGSFALEPNDFDAADYYPYLWELRRLITGVVLAVRQSNPDSDEARTAATANEGEIARACARSYAEALVASASGAAPERIREGHGSAFVADLFARSQKDAERKKELDDLTVVDGGARRLLRGAKGGDPDNRLIDLPSVAAQALAPALASYRLSLLSPPSMASLTVLDAARELGSGVASLARLRIIVLVRGPSDDPSDDELYELKELSDSSARGWRAPGVWFDSPEQRVVASSRALWAIPDADPSWGTTQLLGLPMQAKLETEAHKTLRVRRLTGEYGTPADLASTAALLGRLVARMHARDLARDTIAASVAPDLPGFASEQARVAIAYADQVERDLSIFRRALAELGPTLGVRASDEPSAPELRALFGAGP